MFGSMGMGGGGVAGGAASGAAMGTAIMPGIGTAIGAVAGGVMGALGSRSAKKAAEAQRRAAAEAMRMGQVSLNRQRDIFNPFYGAGTAGLNQLTSRMGELTRRFGLSDFQKDPGYDFRRQEGQTVLEGGAAARGGLYSGAAGKALTRYGQDYASNEYDRAYQRFNEGNANEFNKLAALVGFGQFGAQGLSGAESEYNRNAQSAFLGGANASAAGQIGASNAWQQGLGTAYNAYRDQQILDRFPVRPPYSGGNLSSPPGNFNGTGQVDPYGGI